MLHRMWTDVIQEGQLHYAPLDPRIQEVLDVGTGTGCWAVEFADRHPGAHVIGTDLFPGQPNYIPPNVEFQIDDVRMPWNFGPERFDFIHIRFLAVRPLF